MLSDIWMLCGNCVGGEVRAALAGLGAGRRSPPSPPAALRTQGPPDACPAPLCKAQGAARSCECVRFAPGTRPHGSFPQEEGLPSLRAGGPSKPPVFRITGPTHVSALSPCSRLLRDAVTDHVPGMFITILVLKKVFSTEACVWLAVGGHLRKDQPETCRCPGVACPKPPPPGPRSHGGRLGGCRGGAGGPRLRQPSWPNSRPSGNSNQR